MEMENFEEPFSITENDSLIDVDIEGSMATELCNIDGQQIVLPSELCDNPDALCEMLSLETVQSELSELEIQELKNLLPVFELSNADEQDETLHRLLSGENFCFGNPVRKFAENLQRGFYNPDIAETRRLFKEARDKDYKSQQKSYYCDLLQDVLVSRQRLLETASTLAPGQPIRVPKLISKRNSAAPAFPLLEERAKKRYYEELGKIPPHFDTEEPSSDEDENFPEGPLAPLSKKQRRYMYLLENSYPPDTNFVRSTFASSGVPKLDAADKNDEVPARDASFGLDLMADLTSHKNPYEITEDIYKQLLRTHRRMRRESVDKNENNTSDVTLDAVIKRVKTQHLNFRKPMFRAPVPGRPFSEKKNRPSVAALTQSEESLTSVHISPELEHLKDKYLDESGVIPGPSEHKVSLLKAKLEPVETPLPVKIKKEVEESDKKTPGIVVDRKSDMQASFFCVIRDLLCASPDRSLTLNQLQEQIKFWTLKPTSAVNSWYTNLPSWSNALPSALLHLAGNDTDMDFVPYVVAKAPNVYQWIGVGRDSDAHLTALCQSWLEAREASQPMASAFPLSTIQPVGSPVADIDVDVENCELGPTPLVAPLSLVTEEIFPPRCPTSWVVQPSTDEEKEEFRQQERVRYSVPHKAFTFHVHGYESTVGPLKGVYANTSAPNAASKSRGHVVLNPERPHCVTILSLVRDAVARLPNGEGTRADICELLKDSQYLSPTAELTLQSVVSGALDRLHGETDPCVKYDSGRKIWIYLHRHRTEKEFELLHQQHQGLPIRTKRSAIPRKHKGKALPAPVLNTGTLPLSSTASGVEAKPVAAVPAPTITSTVTTTTTNPLTLLPAKLPTIASLATTPSATSTKVTSLATTIVAQSVTTGTTPLQTTTTTSSAPAKPQTLTLVSGTAASGSTSTAQVQTFQIATSSGIQTIRVSAPAHISPAVLARTLQLSATQPAIQAAVQKLTGGNPTTRPATLSVVPTQQQATKQSGTAANVVVSSSHPMVRPGESLVRVLNINRAARPATSIPANARVVTIPSIRSPATVVRPPTPSTVPTPTPVAKTTPAASTSSPVVTAANAIRLTGKQSVTVPPGSQTILIRPTQTPGTVTATSSGGSGPRLVMINPSSVHGKSDANGKTVSSTATTTTTTTSLGTFINAQGKPVVARVVGGTGGQQVLSLESLLNLAAQPKGLTGATGKAGVVQVPLTALANLQGASGTTIRQAGSGGTTLLVQGVRGTQQVLLPAGFQGVNIRSLQTVQGISGLKNVTLASVGRGGKQPVIARVVNPVRNQAPVTLSSLITSSSASTSVPEAGDSENGKPA